MGDLKDEFEWVRKSREGDTQAFAELVSRYQRMIFTLTYRMSGSLTDAADLTQESFIRAYDRLGGYRGAAKFSSWLYQIAIHTCLNWKKANARREQLHRDWAEQRGVLALATEQKDATEDYLDRVQIALMKLPAKQRAAVVLTVYEAMDHAEAARMLGCSETTVSWRIFAARRKLKRWLTSTR